MQIIIFYFGVKCDLDIGPDICYIHVCVCVSFS